MKIIALMIVILAGISSCYKDVPVPGSSAYGAYHLIPQTVKAYTAFKKGTYWIYKDSATGQIDSQYVTKYLNGIKISQGYSGGAEAYYESFTEYVNGTFDTCSFIYSLSMSSSPAGDSVWEFEEWSRYYPTAMYTDMGSTISFIYPFTDHSNRYGDNNNVVNNTVTYPTYTVNGQTFLSVVCMHQTSDPLFANQPENYFIAPNMGVIRRELLGTHQTWNLIRYHIMQ